MKQKEILLISITIFFTIIAWILADLRHTATTRQVKIDNPSAAKNIKTQVDKEIFKILKNKQ